MWCVIGKAPGEVFSAWAETFSEAYQTALGMIARGIRVVMIPPLKREEA